MIEIFVSKAKKESNGWAAWTYINEETLTGRAFAPGDYVNTAALYIESQNGAVFDLCRELVVLSVPDQPWESFWKPRRFSMSGPSIRRAALMMVKETDMGPRFVKWYRFIKAGDESACADCGDRHRLFKGVCLACAAVPSPANDNAMFLAAATRP